MERVAFQTVLRQAAGLAGFTLAQLTATPRTQFRTFIDRRAREYWDAWWWSQLMHADLRYYRDAYANATTYAGDDEVYYDGAYYRATGSTQGNLPTDTNYWEVITDLDAYILLEQSGKTAIGTVRLLSPDNPLTVRRPRSQPFRMAGERIWVLGDAVPSSIYVWFREQAPAWLGDDFSATATYTAGRIVYYSGSGVDYEGDFWECLSSTSAGEDPEDTAAKWSRVEFPAWLLNPVAQAAYADWLRQDGNPEAAKLEDTVARNLLAKAIQKDSTAQRQILFSSGA